MAKPTKKELKAELKKLDLREGEDFEKTASNKELAELIEDTKAKIAEEAEDVDNVDEEDQGTDDEEETDEEDDEEDDEEEAEDDEEDEDEEEDEEVDETKYGPQLSKNTMKYSGKGSIDIIRGKRYIRTFHEEAHGKDFKKLAEDFINKNTTKRKGKLFCPFKMVNTEKVGRLYVEYVDILKKGDSRKVKAQFGETLEEKEKALQLANDRCVNVCFE